MTVLDLQTKLAKEIEKLTKGMLLKNSLGKETKLKAYKQSLPMSTGEERTDPYPYCMVQIDSGGMEDCVSPQKAQITLLIGIYDDRTEAQGHIAVCNVIQRIQERFCKNPVLGGHYVMDGKFDWALQEEETYPYYIGAIITTWILPSIERE